MGPPSIPVGFAAAGQAGTGEPPGLSETQLSRVQSPAGSRSGSRAQRGHTRPSPQKLQLALAPLHSLASLASEHGLPDPGSLLVHSFRQLDRVDSLSEQISFLEEQLGSCSCRKEL